MGRPPNKASATNQLRRRGSSPTVREGVHWHRDLRRQDACEPHAGCVRSNMAVARPGGRACTGIVTYAVRMPANRTQDACAPNMKKRKSITRRSFVKVLPAAGAAAIVATKAPFTTLPQTPMPTPLASPSASPPTARVKKDDLKHAEKIIGIDFNDKEEDMALPGVNRNLDSYDAVRKIDVPLDTEPAVVFHPELPGFHVKRASAKTKFKFGKNEP